MPCLFVGRLAVPFVCCISGECLGDSALPPLQQSRTDAPGMNLQPLLSIQFLAFGDILVVDGGLTMLDGAHLAQCAPSIRAALDRTVQESNCGPISSNPPSCTIP